MLDNKGSFYIIDAILAVVLILTVFLVANTAITLPSAEYSYESKDITDAQDVMGLLGGKIDFSDQTFLGKISTILKENKNSKEAIRQVSDISKNKLNSYKLNNYRFSENNVLKEETLASSGEYSEHANVSVATRTYGDYSYTLSVW